MGVSKIQLDDLVKIGTNIFKIAIKPIVKFWDIECFHSMIKKNMCIDFHISNSKNRFFKI